MSERQRFLQFSLRGLIALVLAVGVVLGWWTYERNAVRRQRLASEEIRRLQAQLTAPEQFWIEEPLRVETKPAPWWLRIGGERSRITVTAVSFDLRSYDAALEEESGITDEHLRLVAACPQLQSLRLPRSRISDDGLRQVRSLRRLAVLDLAQTQVTDRGLTHLRSLSSLESLNLSRVKLQGDGLVHLEHCRALKELSLGGTSLRAEHAELLNRLASLEVLTLDSATLDRLSLRRLPNLRELTVALAAPSVELRLEQLPRLENVSIQLPAPGSPTMHLSDLPRLTTLTVHGGDETAAASFVLRRTPRLHTVSLAGGGLASAALREAARVESLEELSVHGGAALDDAAVRELSRLPHLRRAELERTRLTDAGLQSLAAAKSLERLSLESSQVSEGGVQALGALPRLRVLHLVGAHASGDLGVALRGSRSLEELTLSDVNAPALTLESGPADAAFAKLKTLVVTGGAVKQVRVAGLPVLKSLNLTVPHARRVEAADLTQLQHLDISLAAGQTVEKFTLRGLPRLAWMSIQCGPTGAQVPRDTFEHLNTFKQLRSGMVWGLDLPPQAQADLDRWEKATGINL